jgi:hypothetical protein
VESQWFLKGCLFATGKLPKGRVLNATLEELRPLLKPMMDALNAHAITGSLLQKARYDGDGQHAAALLVPIEPETELYLIHTSMVCPGYIPLVLNSGNDAAVWLVDYIKTLESQAE